MTVVHEAPKELRGQEYRSEMMRCMDSIDTKMDMSELPLVPVRLPSFPSLSKSQLQRCSSCYAVKIAEHD